MKKKKSKFVMSVFFVFLFQISLFAQDKVQIKISDVKYQKEELIVTYLILNAEKNDKFNIWLELKDANDEILTITKLSGDVGKGVSKHQGNVITCNLKENNIYINSEISAQVFGDYLYTNANITNITLNSLIFPGLGKYKFNYNKYYFSIGIVAYASVFGAFYYDYKYKNTYNLYLTEPNIEQRNNYFAKSISEYKTSNLFTGVAVGIWSLNLASSLFMLNYYKKKGQKRYSFFYKYKLDFSYDTYVKAPSLSLKYYF